MTANTAQRHDPPYGHDLGRCAHLGSRFPDADPVGLDSEAEPDKDALRVTPNPIPASSRCINPARRPLPPKQLPTELRDVIVTAYERRATAAAGSAADHERLRPMWELTTTLCAAVPEMAGEPGEVAVRLCELPSDATAEQVWDRVRTAPRVDMWEYSHEHHHCVRVGDWHPWSP